MLMFLIWLLALMYAPTAPPESAEPEIAGKHIDQLTTKPRAKGARMAHARQFDASALARIKASTHKKERGREKLYWREA